LDWLTETGGDTLDGLASLLDKSLIRKVDADDVASRLVMLEGSTRRSGWTSCPSSLRPRARPAPPTSPTSPSGNGRTSPAGGARPPWRP
jgi:hypothetical protein